MTAPSIEYAALSPFFIIFGVAIAGVLVEAFGPRASRYAAQLTLALAGIVAAFVAVVGVYRQTQAGRIAAMGAVAVDRPALFLQGAILVVAVLGVLLIGERVAAPLSVSTARGLDGFTPQASTAPGSVAEQIAVRAGISQTEVFPLTMFAVGGMMLFPASADLLTMFIALEVFSLPLYLMCGLARHRRLLSQEAALKYFLLGAFSSAFFLFGTALLYGYAGTLSLSGIAAAVGDGSANTALAVIGIALVAAGLLFKIGAVPFHAWVPDVYQGAPTPITAFMAAATKIAAFGALLRLLYIAVPALKNDWRPVLWAVAILTMVLGTIAAVTQRDVKRMLAYSAVAHTGFILTGMIAGNQAGVFGTLFYLAAYGLSTLGAFAVVGIVRDAGGQEQTELSAWAGLGRNHPLTGVVFSLFLLAFAGIPLTSGFVSKFAVFKAAGEGGAIPLVIVGVIASAIAAYFYVRVIVLMYFVEPNENTASVVVPSAFTTVALAVAATITVVVGIMPQPVLELIADAGIFIR